MEGTVENVCSACSQFCSSKIISLDTDLLERLTFLVVGLNTTIKCFRLCEPCLEKIQEAYNFKMVYVKNVSQSCTVLKAREEIDSEIFGLCHVCRNIVKKTSCVSLLNFTNEIKYIEHSLEESSLKIPEDSHICVSCQESLLKFHSTMNLLSVSLENQKCINNLKFEYQDTSFEHTSVNKLILDINKTIKDEITKTDSEESSRYEEFICKNEHLDLKVDSEESFATEELWQHEEHETSFPNFAAQSNNNNISTPKDDKFNCYICEYKSKEKSSLKRHMLIHKDIKEIRMFTCEICGHKEREKGNLKKHKLIHKDTTEIQMFNCVCGCKTRTKRFLKKHMLVHKDINEVKIFMCDICEFTTKRKGNLKNHKLTHRNIVEINIEAFSCDICDYKTMRKCDLKRHKLTHKNINENEVFSCKICNFTAKREENLRRHIVLGHTL